MNISTKTIKHNGTLSTHGTINLLPLQVVPHRLRLSLWLYALAFLLLLLVVVPLLHVQRRRIIQVVQVLVVVVGHGRGDDRPRRVHAEILGLRLLRDSRIHVQHLLRQTHHAAVLLALQLVALLQQLRCLLGHIQRHRIRGCCAAIAQQGGAEHQWWRVPLQRMMQARLAQIQRLVTRVRPRTR